jgi:hypothetical protein
MAPSQPAASTGATSEYVCPIGKEAKGLPLGRVDTSFLVWALDNAKSLSDFDREQFRAEIMREGGYIAPIDRKVLHEDVMSVVRGCYHWLEFRYRNNDLLAAEAKEITDRLVKSLEGLGA